MKNYWIGWMLIAVMAAGCEADDAEGLQIVDRNAITFDAQMGRMEEVTRGAHAMETNDALATEGGFGVFACYTGLHRFRDSNIQSDFMYNTHVVYDNVNGVWNYDPMKYWPNGAGQADDAAKHYVSFFAYAPYSNQDPENAAGYCIPSFHLQSEVTNPWLTYRLHTDPAQQVDLMYALPLIDRCKGDAPREVFTFRHALACVGDRVTVTMADELKAIYQGRVTEHADITGIEVQLKSVALTYHLTERARLVLWTGGEANWQQLKSGEALTEREIVLKSGDDASPYTLYSYDGTEEDGDDWEDTGNGIFYIPIHREGHLQTVQANITYDVVTEYTSGTTRDSKETTGIVTLSDFADAYQAGRHLYLNMKLVNE